MLSQHSDGALSLVPLSTSSSCNKENCLSSPSQGLLLIKGPLSRDKSDRCHMHQKAVSADLLCPFSSEPGILAIHSTGVGDTQGLVISLPPSPRGVLSYENATWRLLQSQPCNVMGRDGASNSRSVCSQITSKNHLSDSSVKWE